MRKIDRYLYHLSIKVVSMKKKISITIDEDLLEEVDEIRGRVPRSGFIEEALEEN